MNRARWVLVGVIAATGLAWPTARLVRSVMMTRGGVATFARLLGAANAGDLDAARAECSRRYRAAHPIERSRDGGVVGFPRIIHRNFQAWVDDNDVWLCPTDRVGPVYRLVLEEDRWKFDGLVGLLGAGGRVELADESMVDDR